MSWGETRVSTIAPGAVLRGRYRLDSEIGRGAMGVVFRATDLELARHVAVKIMSGATSSDAHERFVREARAAASLNHPHIVSVQPQQFPLRMKQCLPTVPLELVRRD